MALVYTAGSSLTPLAPFTTSQTFTNCNGGVPFPSGSIVVAFVGWYAGNAQPLSSATTIGGQTAIIINGTPNNFSVAPTNNSAITAIFASMPSSQTDSVTIVTTDTTDGWAVCSVSCIILTGAASTPTASSIQSPPGNIADPQTPNTSINLPAGGVGIVGLVSQGTASVPTPTWLTTGNSAITSTSGDINSNLANHNFQLLVAHSTTANASWLPSITGSPAYNFSAGMVALTWAAGGAGPVLHNFLTLGVGA